VSPPKIQQRLLPAVNQEQLKALLIMVFGYENLRSCQCKGE